MSGSALLDPGHLGPREFELRRSKCLYVLATTRRPHNRDKSGVLVSLGTGGHSTLALKLLFCVLFCFVFVFVFFHVIFRAEWVEFSLRDS